MLSEPFHNENSVKKTSDVESQDTMDPRRAKAESTKSGNKTESKSPDEKSFVSTSSDENSLVLESSDEVCILDRNDLDGNNKWLPSKPKRPFSKDTDSLMSCKGFKEDRRFVMFGFFVFSIALCAVCMLAVFFGVIESQLDTGRWATKTLRVEFGESDLQSYSGCYEMDPKQNLLRRYVYSNGNLTDESPSFAYCKTKRKWFLLSEDFDYDNNDNVCEANEMELAHSRTTNYFDISTEFNENWYTASGEPLEVDFIELDMDHQGNCTHLGDGKCHEDFNVFKYGYDAGDCCIATCTNANCGALRDIRVFGTNTTGVHFPTCVDPKMRDITIYLDNFSSSYDTKNRDILHPNRLADYDDWYDMSRDVEASRMTVECDGRYALVANVDNTMECQSQTIRVSDGANCKIEVERKIEKPDCDNDCYKTEYPFWVFRYSVYDGHKRDNDMMIHSQDSIQREVSSFWVIPTCYSDKLNGGSRISELYEDENVLKSFRWMWEDKSGHSSCQLDTIMDRFQLVRFFLKTKEEGKEVLRKTSHCFWKGVACEKEGKFMLSATNMSGTSPSEIAEIENLIDLDLSELNAGNNRLTGSIPSEIGNLQQLQKLDITYNDGLTGSGNLSELLCISFEDTQIMITEEVHELLCNMPKYTCDLPVPIDLRTFSEADPEAATDDATKSLGRKKVVASLTDINSVATTSSGLKDFLALLTDING